jgi:PAS domain S-box-containing protein
VKKYRTIFENVRDVFYKIDMQGIIHEISPSVKHFSGFNREALIGQSVYTIYEHPETREKCF